MEVKLSTSKNFVQDLAEMIENGLEPKVFFALFENDIQIRALKEALNVLNLKIYGIISDDQLYKIRIPTMQEKIKKFIESKNYKKYSLKDIKKIGDSNQSIVIIVNNHIDYFYKAIDVIKNNNINCYLHHYMHIPGSAVVNGTVRVINRVWYLKHWPWFLDILNKDMSPEDRDEFIKTPIMDSVVSNGKYYYIPDKSTRFAEFKEGRRLIFGYEAISNQKKYTITLLGDSRFVNGMVPTELTIGQYLQNYFIERKLNYEVKNFSVLANSYQNAFSMLKSLEINSLDVIIVCVRICDLCYSFSPQKSDTLYTEDSDSLLRVKAQIMNDMTQYAHSKGAEIIFVHLPTLLDIPNLTHIEQFIISSYNLKYSPNVSHRKLAELCMAFNIKMIDFTETIINTNRPSFFIDLTHLSPEGSKLVAKTLSEYIETIVKKDELINDDYVKSITSEAYESHKKYVLESRFGGLLEYVEKLKETSKDKPKNCGAIVMNCNPFTLGHRYLIEYAKSKVDYLYILAVEEDRSAFKFKDRFEMIKQGVADMTNVEVIPSGKFVISSLTFPEYFEKNQKQAEIVDTTADIEIFGEYIAPALKVVKRFVGEEPIDMVTKQYNMKMNEILPKYNISLVEIPRKNIGGAPISASRVRKLLQEKQYEEIKNLVPITTYNYLIDILGY